MRTWAGVLTHAREEYVVHRCQNKNPREWMWSGMWMTSCTGGVRGETGSFEKVSSWVLRSKEEGWLSLARRGLVAGNTRVGEETEGKNQHRKIVLLSPYVEKPLNSKVIKGFVPELGSRYVFFVFRDSYVLCIYAMNILCTFQYSCMGMLHNCNYYSSYTNPNYIKISSLRLI